jgi:DNA-binding response OmpR family regulator
MKNNRPSVLIIEDDANLVLVLKQFILSLGLNANSTYSGKKGFKKALSNKYQLFIIDLGLGDISGLKLVEKIRITNNKPIIIITGNVEENNEIECFKLKANIFHKKPINFDILAVQIKSLISPKRRGNIITSKNVYINLNKRVFKFNDQVVPLTKREFNFLTMLFNSNGEVFTRKQIIYNIMNYFSSSSENCVDTMVSRIRKKLNEEDIKNSLIKTVNCTGYKLNSEYFKNIQRSFS